MIHIIKHKEFNNPVPEGYQEIGVGPMFKDTTDNINHLNPVINELTGIYDVWKNQNDEIVGFCHYHRFFTEVDKILTLDRAEELLEDYEIILANRVVYRNEFLYNTLANDFREDLSTYGKYMSMLLSDNVLKLHFMQNTFHPRNMFICSREILDQYCEWLFSKIIPVAEAFLANDYNRYPHYYNRMIGFIAERFLTCWVKYVDLKYIELPYEET